MAENNGVDIQSSEIESKPGVVSFSPPVYIQRYLAIADILQNEPWKHRISRVVDFGCAELKLFKYLKRIENISHVSAVDIDGQLILRNLHEVKPLLFDHVGSFSKRLSVDLFCGSIAEPDERLIGVDAVICIELIEHLYDDVLNLVPSTVFNYLKPKLAIFTTPNADFNVLFDLKTFRHYDHKFEWTRAEFENWCMNITSKYPNYNVSFEGIGKGPEGTDHLGCCSQMAIFTLKNDTLLDNSHYDQAVGQPYELLHTIEYPFKSDERDEDQKFCDEVTYRISNIITSRDGAQFQRYDSKYAIPVNHLWIYLKEWCPTVEKLHEKLVHKDYMIEINDENELVLIYDDFNYSNSESEESDFEDNITQRNVQLEEEIWT